MPYQPTLDLRTIRAVVLDLDGVVWRGSEPLPGVPEFFLFLRQRGIPYLMVTNNSTRTIDEFVNKIGSLGIPVEAEHIITSGLVTAEEVARSYPLGTPIYVIGSESLIRLLTARGMVFDPDRARVVVMGLDTNLTYQKLIPAGRRILEGAAFIGTNADATFPMPDGLIPGAGSLLAILETMTGQKARIMGKPEAVMFHTALAALGTPPAQTLMVGDRLDTDILGAQRVGMPTAMVLTGISTADEVEHGDIKPEGLYESLAHMHQVWRDL